MKILEGKREIQPWFEAVQISKTSSRLSGVIFFLLCLTLVFSTVDFGAVDQGSWVVLTIITFAIVALWFTDTWQEQAFLVNRHVLLLPLLGLILISILQILPLFQYTIPVGLIADPARATISLDPYATRLFIGRLVIYLVFFAAAITFLNNNRRLRKIILLIVIFGCVMAFFGILQRLANPDAIYGLRGTPQSIPFGPFVNQHHFAAFMEMTAGITFGFLFSNAVRRDKRLLIAIAAIVMGIATVMTSSRGGILSFAGTLIFALTANFMAQPSENIDANSSDGRQQKIAAIAGALALIILIFGIVLFLGADSSLMRGIGLGGGDDVSSGRSHFWPIALQIFLDHPLFGAGFDSFGAAFTKYDSWPGTFRVEQAHNDYLQILADAGVVGFVCVAAYIYFLFRKGLGTITSSSDPFRRSAAVGALAGCFGILIHSFFDFPLRTPSNAFFFLTLTAIAIVHIKPKRA